MPHVKGAPPPPQSPRASAVLAILPMLAASGCAWVRVTPRGGLQSLPRPQLAGACPCEDAGHLHTASPSLLRENDMERATDTTATTPTIHQLIAARVPWPSLKDRPRRQHLRLEWRVIDTAGAELVARTPHPFEDGATALLTLAHALPGDLVTMRHAGAAHDSFLPQPIEKIAARTRKRAEAAKRVRAWRASQ